MFCFLFVGVYSQTLSQAERISFTGGNGDIIQPSPTLVFSFPEVTTINIISGTASNVNLNIFFLNDPTITNIPADFSDHLPSLLNFKAIGCPITTVSPFFNNSMLRNVEVGPLTHLTIDPTLNLPNLDEVILTINLAAPEAFIFTQKSFPKLRNVYIDATGSPLTVNINSTMIQNLGFNNRFGTINLVIESSPSLINSLILNGFDSTVTPSLDQFIGLDSLRVSYSSMSTFPFVTYPPGEIPWTLFDNKIQLMLDITGNIGITGAVPQSFCPNKIYMDGTSITSVPDIVFESTDLITIDRVSVARGHPMGWGGIFLGGSNIYYSLEMIAYDAYRFTLGTAIYGIKTPFTMMTDSNYPEYSYSFTYLEVKFSLATVNVVQVPNGLYQLQLIHVENIEDSLLSLDYSISINDTIPCSISSIVGTTITCTPTSTLSVGQQVNVFNSNNYWNASMTVIVTNLYPNITLPTTTNAQIGGQLTFQGTFGPNVNSAIIYINGDDSICIIGGSMSSVLICNVVSNFVGGLTNVTISVDGFTSTPFFVNYTTPQTECLQLTNNCTNHGNCDINGQCQCNNGYYSNDCSIGYPVLSSGTYDKQDNKLISLFGNFGPYNQANVSVLVNSTLDCVVTYKSQYNINCTLGSNPTAGLVSFQIQVDNLNGSAKDLFYIHLNNGTNGGTTTTSSTTGGGGGETAQEKCQRKTSNCYGHGKCDVNGVCQCELNYQPLDNCLTKIINNTIQPNNTSPTPAFNIDGVTFLFEVVAIQEIGIDNELIFELLTNKWNSNITNSSDTTIAVYNLNHTLGNTTIITSTISFSSKPRDIPFGSQVLHINPIQLNCRIMSLVGDTLQSYQHYELSLKQRSTIIKQSSLIVKDIPIDSLTFDQMSSSLQYLRVIKDNIQFTGRFIDYVLSDGREAFSRTYVINQTSVQGSDDKQSNILLGIGMPQCQSCVLDPDFSPLIVDKSNDSGCDSQSNTWRIIVGVVVGGVALLAISAASVFFYRKKWSHQRQEISMNSRLRSMRE
ncbi:hypothetical protein DFA_09624 [Cavenderia fasciculata]|uniref:EGF-like domain-containing protein n=1 Tax=Cavenderia fasciculata TaxID=261658 RepID=F4Q853_CACFS|nr:uncharacterized protein DFA_09624 [Cavenderia fasciculata]EGG15953.1 hypothetical protein DFA_09624 [Cavenderia fasciculata]|eukprot:XP_004352278.1 hypothetical protein DFA_09624 [Cavenderia fasciculata]